MADIHSKEIRSYNMSRVKSKDTKPEMLVRKFLHKNGFRYRLHVKNLPGKPDIVLPKYKTVIFIHGCFWHGHENCKKASLPKTRTEWWTDKIGKNGENDQKAETILSNLGWKVIKIWECELKSNVFEKTLNKLLINIIPKHP
ncbi:MAG: very short patch repair endonuclease [Mucilaginibacter sp.]|uniref:very short patch repair endonuclease n=1 Tax=Mucilaginibacter sp. TaxID=1882438 RepID=UPI0034E58749